MSYWVFVIPVISAVIGYVTNWVAIRMLFRPHHEKRVFGVRVPFTPGLIPKRREHLALSIGRSVSRYLLTHEAISARLERPAFRKQVDRLIDTVSAGWLQTDLPSVNELVPERFRQEWRQWVEGAKGRLDVWIEKILTAPELVRLVEQQTEARFQAFLDMPLEALLPKDVLDAVPGKVSGLLQRLIENENIQEHIDHFLVQRLEKITKEDRSLADLIPERLQDIIYEKLEDAVPMILERLVKIFEDDRVRKRIKMHLFDMVDKLLDKQFKGDSVWDQFKFGLMESFVISPEDMKARIEDAVNDAAPRLAELIKQDDVRQKVYQALVEAIEKFLHKKISEFNVEAGTMIELKTRLSGWIASVLQSETLHAQLVQLIAGQIKRHRDQSLRQLLPDFSDETLAQTSRRASAKLLQWLQGETVRQKLAAFTATQIDRFLERPLGRLDRFVPQETIVRARDVAAEQLVALLIRETPRIIEGLDVEKLVSGQVNEFSLDEVERLVVGITGNHLRAITWFGAILGFLLGLLQLTLLLLAN